MPQQPDLDAILKKYGGTIAGTTPAPIRAGADLDAILKKYGGTVEGAVPSSPYDTIIDKYSADYDVPSDLVRSIIQQESAGRKEAIGPVTRTGERARGLMQLMPETAKQYGVTDPLDPDQNIRAGIQHLAWLRKRYPGDDEKVIAAYNAGHVPVDKHGGIPPYPETQAYVPKVQAGRGAFKANDPASTPGQPAPISQTFSGQSAGTVATPQTPSKEDWAGAIKAAIPTVAGNLMETLPFKVGQPAVEMARGAAKVVQGAGQLAKVPGAIPGLSMAAQDPAQMAEGLNRVVEGSLEFGAPLILPAMVASPVFTPAMLGAAMFAQRKATSYAKEQGWPEEYQRLAGNIATLLTLGVGSPRVLKGVKDLSAVAGEAGAVGVKAIGDTGRASALALQLNTASRPQYGPGNVTPGYSVEMVEPMARVTPRDPAGEAKINPEVIPSRVTPAARPAAPAAPPLAQPAPIRPVAPPPEMVAPAPAERAIPPTVAEGQWPPVKAEPTSVVPQTEFDAYKQLQQADLGPRPVGVKTPPTEAEQIATKEALMGQIEALDNELGHPFGDRDDFSAMLQTDPADLDEFALRSTLKELQDMMPRTKMLARQEASAPPPPPPPAAVAPPAAALPTPAEAAKPPAAIEGRPYLTPDMKPSDMMWAYVENTWGNRFGQADLVDAVVKAAGKNGFNPGRPNHRKAEKTTLAQQRANVLRWMDWNDRGLAEHAARQAQAAPPVPPAVEPPAATPDIPGAQAIRIRNKLAERKAEKQAQFEEKKRKAELDTSADEANDAITERRRAIAPAFVEDGLYYRQTYVNPDQWEGSRYNEVKSRENPDKDVPTHGKTFYDTILKAEAWLKEHPELDLDPAGHIVPPHAPPVAEAPKPAEAAKAQFEEKKLTRRQRTLAKTKAEAAEQTFDLIPMDPVQERREVARILAEMNTGDFTPTSYTNIGEDSTFDQMQALSTDLAKGQRLTGTGRATRLRVSGSAGAPIYDDILAHMPGSSRPTRSGVIAAIQTWLDTGKVTSPVIGALEVARIRAGLAQPRAYHKMAAPMPWELAEAKPDPEVSEYETRDLINPDTSFDVSEFEPADATPAEATAAPSPVEALPIDTREAWQVPEDELIQYKDTLAKPKNPPASDDTDMSEAAMYARALRYRRDETEPPDVPQHPVGSWGVDSTGELMQLREYDINDPILRFNEGEKKNATTEKYAEWIKAGHEPPALQGLETEKGSVNIQEGHHRWSALKQAGRDKVKVWVSITRNVDIGKGVMSPRGVKHADLVKEHREAARKEDSAPSPESVERDLQDMAAKFNEQPIIATPDELAGMIAAQKAKIAEMERRSHNINYRVRNPALEALPGLRDGLKELEDKAGIKPPPQPESGDLLSRSGDQVFDEYANKHLDAWLEDNVSEDSRARTKNRIVDLLADHPEMIGRGWPALYDIVQAQYAQPKMAPIIGPSSPSPKPKVVTETVIEAVPNPNPNWSDIRLVKREKDNGDIFYSILYDSKIDGTQHGRAFKTEEEARKWREGMVAHEREGMDALKASDEKAVAEGKATRAQRGAAQRYIERQRTKGWARGNFADAYWSFLQGERDAPDVPIGVGPVVRWDIIAELTRIAGKPEPSKAEASRDAFNARKKGRRK